MKVKIDVGFGRKIGMTIPTMKIPTTFEIQEISRCEASDAARCWIIEDTEIPSRRSTSGTFLLRSYGNKLYEPYLIRDTLFGHEEISKILENKEKYYGDNDPKRFVHKDFLKKNGEIYDFSSKYRLVHEDLSKNYGAATGHSKPADENERKIFAKQYESARKTMEENLIKKMIFIDDILYMEAMPPLIYLKHGSMGKENFLTIGRVSHFDKMMKPAYKLIKGYLLGRIFSLTDLEAAINELKIMNGDDRDTDMRMLNLEIYDEKAIFTDTTKLNLSLAKDLIADVISNEIKEINKEEAFLYKQIKMEDFDDRDTSSKLDMIDKLINLFFERKEEGDRRKTYIDVQNMEDMQRAKRSIDRIKDHIATNEMSWMGI